MTNTQEKYGFVYIWYDKRHGRFYIGRHWGTEDDGYICSSNNMRDAHRRRPQDFKRRTITRVDSKEQLVLEEQRYLDMINPDHLGKKYYNKTNKASTPSMRGRKHSEETKRKMSISATGVPCKEETKEKLRQANLGKTYSSEINAKKGRMFSEERRRKHSLRMKEFWTEAKRKQVSETMKRIRRTQ